MHHFPARFFVFLILVSFPLMVSGQGDFSKDDTKKLEKARKLNEEADELVLKASEVYQEISELRDENAEKNQKKIDKLTSKALGYQIESLEKQKEANINLYEVYKNQVEDFRKERSGDADFPTEAKLLEEQADELFYRAEALRNEAYDIKEENFTKYNKLSQAQEYEKEGLDKYINAYDIYTGKVESQIMRAGKKALSEAVPDVEINEELLKDYLDYLAANDQWSLIDQIYEYKEEGALSEKFKEYLEAYRYEDLPEVLEEDNAVALDSSETFVEEEMLADAEETSGETSTEHVQEMEKETGTSGIDKPDGKSKEAKTPESGPFLVQIAMDKHTLSQGTLQKLYKENWEIEIINEEGWKKYSIGEFPTYEEAEAFKKELKVPEAFIVSADQVEKADVTEEEPMQETVAEVDEEPAVEPLATAGYDFQVQIAADRYGLSNQQLNDIYSGSNQVFELQEEGWHKYRIGHYDNFLAAKEKLQEVDVPGSFIVAYKDGEKVPLYLARKGARTGHYPAVATGNVIYRVQIAADINGLTDKALAQIYNGQEPMRELREEGWQKYQLGPYQSFAEAKAVRKSCGVDDAFIVAYRNDQKVDLFQARQKSTDCFTPRFMYEWPEDPNRLVFRVQIAASTVPLTKEQVKQIYCREEKVYVIQEDGYHKYSVGSFYNYQQARAHKININVEGAFVVSYRGKRKIPVNKLLNKIEQN